MKKNFLMNKYIIFKFFTLLIFFFLYAISNSHIIQILIEFQYQNYIKKCNEENIKRQFNKQTNIFLSICLPVYNMEKYIKSSLSSIINQSFQIFEVIIVNDNSNDNTKNEIDQIQAKDKRIKLINHSKNMGLYSSRADAVLSSNGKYILLMDPDDILINPNLFQQLYTYNKPLNLDIIEFMVYHQKDGMKNFYFPKNHLLNHYHNYNKKIITQPELSDIIFYIPNTKKYSSIICRTIWNKLIRKEIIFNSINYLSNNYFQNHFLIAADDTAINVISFYYANNYSNIKLPGYLYKLREKGMSKLQKTDIEHNVILCSNYLLYFRFLYEYITKFKKDINFFFYDFKAFSPFISKFKNLNSTKYIHITLEFLEEISKRNIPKKFKPFLKKLKKYFLSR